MRKSARIFATLGLLAPLAAPLAMPQVAFAVEDTVPPIVSDETEDEVDWEMLDYAIEESNNIDVSCCTALSIKEFDAARKVAVDKARQTKRDNKNPTVEDVQAALDEFNVAIEQAKDLLKPDPLHPRPDLDKRLLHDVIQIEASISIPMGYTDESVTECFKLRDQYVAEAEKVLADKNATQAQVDAAVAALRAGIEHAKSVLVKVDAGTPEQEKKTEADADKKPAAKPEDKSADKKLPQTGDAAVMYAAAAAAAGAIALGSTAAVRRRS